MKNINNKKVIKYSNLLINVLAAAYSISGLVWLIFSIKPLFNNKMMLVELDPFNLFGATLGSGNYFMFKLLRSYYEWYLFTKTILLFVSILYLLFCFKKFVQNIIYYPFETSNGELLKKIGVVVVAISVVMYLLKFLESFVSDSTTVFTVIGELIAVIINPFALLGIVLFVVGEVFIYGTEIQQENDLTV